MSMNLYNILNFSQAVICRFLLLIVILPVSKQTLLYQVFHELVFCGTNSKHFIAALSKVFLPFLDTYYLFL